MVKCGANGAERGDAVVVERGANGDERRDATAVERGANAAEHCRGEAAAYEGGDVATEPAEWRRQGRR